MREARQRARKLVCHVRRRGCSLVEELTFDDDCLLLLVLYCMGKDYWSVNTVHVSYQQTLNGKIKIYM